MLAATLALASPASRPAIANCTGTTIVTCAPPGTGGFVAAIDGVNVTVVPGATVVDDGVQAISLNNTSSVVNNGAVTAATNNTFGILLNGDNNTVVNNSTITAGGDQTLAIVAGGVGNNIVNSGSGVINVSGASAVGIVSNGGNQITNAGTVIVSGPSDPLALTVGILPFTGDVVTNSGSILITSDGAVGILATNGQPTSINTGTITASAPNAVGIFADGSAFTTNSGFIAATGAGSVGVALQGNWAGLVLTDPASFTNNGTIFAPAGAFSLTTRLSSALIVNNGLIDGRIVFAGTGAGDLLINNGTIQISNGPLADHTLAGGLFQQSASGTLALRVNSGGGSDTLTVDLAQLNGTLRAVIQPGLYGTTTTYLGAVTACGFCGLTGTFSTVSSSSPFFNASAFYDASTANLVLTRLAFGAVPGLTLNQRAVATALDANYSTTLTGNAATLFGNLLAATSVGALDQLSGEGMAALHNASIGAGSLFNNAALNQLVFGDASGAASVIVPPAQYAATRKPRGQEAFAAIKPAAPAAAQTGRWRIWTLGFGGSRSLDGTLPAGSEHQTIRNYGGAFGFDYRLAPDLLLGFSAGGSGANVSVPARSTTGEMSGGHVGLYGVKTWGAAYAAAAASYAQFDNSTTRTIAGVGPTEIASGKFASDQLSARLELGWKRTLALATLTPFVAIEPAALWTHGYTETSSPGGILGLRVASRTTTSLPTFVGIQAETRVRLGDGVLSPYARLSWVHEFEPARQVTATFVSVPAATFTVDGARPASDAARIDTGAKYEVGPGRSLFTHLSGEWSNIGQSYAAAAGFRLVR